MEGHRRGASGADGGGAVRGGVGDGLWRGGSRFDVTWSGAPGENPVHLAIADLDGDGLADLAVANHETDHVTLLFGIAGRALERRDHSRLRVDVSPHPYAVRLHDIDSDGHGDLRGA